MGLFGGRQADQATGGGRLAWRPRQRVIAPRKRRLGKAAKDLFLRGQGLLQGAALRADATVTVSPTVAMELRSRYGFQGEITVIPNGVATKTGHPREEARSSASSNDGPLRVIWVGTSGYRKGLDLALGACELARARGQNRIPHRGRRPVESAGLERTQVGSWLTGLGSVPPGEMEALYRRHDVMLFPTRYEACPMVVLEALAEGLPVIGSSVLQWLVEDAGEVIAGEDTGAYADALRSTRGPGPTPPAGKASPSSGPEHFPWEASAAGYLEVLNNVAKQSGRQRRNREKHPPARPFRRGMSLDLPLLPNWADPGQDWRGRRSTRSAWRCARPGPHGARGFGAPAARRRAGGGSLLSIRRRAAAAAGLRLRPAPADAAARKPSA